jgi:Protein kinase domain.
MIQNTWKNRFNPSPGTVIRGIWNQNRYQIIRELGKGANGAVFLAKGNDTLVAIKGSDQTSAIISEVNVLKSLAKARGINLGPSLIDVDDWQDGNRKYSFYVMEFIEGPLLMDFLRKNGGVWLDIFLLQLLNDLDSLHQQGYVFGDLKPENLLIAEKSLRIRCIDVGGITSVGRSIREFTEFYDRGYWGLGSRKADPAYDLFAVAMIIMNTAYPERFPKLEGGLSQLRRMAAQKQELKKYEPILLKAWKGDYRSAGQMRADLAEITFRTGTADIAKPAGQKRSKGGGWLETAAIFLMITLIYFIYLFSQIAESL